VDGPLILLAHILRHGGKTLPIYVSPPVMLGLPDFTSYACSAWQYASVVGFAERSLIRNKLVTAIATTAVSVGITTRSTVMAVRLLGSGLDAVAPRY
jgi:hypothetical protein